MKQGIRIIAFLLSLMLMLSSIGFAASTQTEIQLYNVEIQDGACIIAGTLTTVGSQQVTLTMEAQGGSSAPPVSLSITTSSNGKFAFFCEVEDAAYQVTITGEKGGRLTTSIDFTEFAQLFDSAKEAGYTIQGVSFEEKVITLKGSNSNAVNGLVLLKMTSPGVEETADALQGVVQTRADESGAFAIQYEVGSGSYQMALRANGQSAVTGIFTVPELVDALAPDAPNAAVAAMVAKVEGYLQELEEKLAECASKNISTDYETVNYQIIKKFIDYIWERAENEDMDRVNQYFDSLTELYEEANQNLDFYLSSTKLPLSVPRFRLGDSLKFDGTTILGLVEENGVIEERPVFLNGWGSFGTPIENTPFLSQIGMNLTQCEVDLKKIIVPVKGDGWEYLINRECEGAMATTTEDKASGTYALKVTKQEPISTEKNVFVTLRQEIPVKPNTTYTLEYKAKGKGIAENGLVIDFANVTWGRNRFPIANSDTWQTYRHQIRTGATDSVFYLVLIMMDLVGEAYIDDISVKEVGTDIELAINGNFDQDETMTPLEEEMAEEGWYVNWKELNRLKALLEQAEANNVMVDVPLCLHLIPRFILESDPDIQAHTSYFLPFALDNPTIHKVTESVIQLLASIIEDCKAVRSICITNEPSIYSGYSEYYRPQWEAYLKSVYGNVWAMNLKLGTLYTGFAKVPLLSSMDGTPLFEDYRNFNNKLLADYHRLVAAEVKKYAPDIKVYAKYIGYFHESYQNQYLRGADYETVADDMDINGCDGLPTYGEDATWSMIEKMGWYDLMTSMADKPVWDTEHHILKDSPTVLEDEIIPQYTSAELWNGAVHGKGASVLWLWEDINTTGIYDNTNAKRRPDMMAEMSKTALDMNRLSRELNAIQREEAKVGILYSMTTLAYDSAHMTACIDTYKECLYHGQKVKFVVDTKPEAMQDFDLLIVPAATYVKEETLNQIQTYVQNGGEVLILGVGALAKNEYKKSHSTTMVNAIHQAADTTSTVAQKIQAMDLSKVKLVDAATGAELQNMEWTYGKYNNQYVVNILNYDFENAKNFKVLFDGKEVKTLKELRKNTTVNSGVLTAKPYEPILVSFDIFTFDLVDQNGNVLEENIDTVKNGIIRCNAQAEGRLILALYQGNRLVKANMEGNTIEVLMEDNETYCLKAMDWDMETLQPLAKSRSITTEVEQ